MKKKEKQYRRIVEYKGIDDKSYAMLAGWFIGVLFAVAAETSANRTIWSSLSIVVMVLIYIIYKFAGRDIRYAEIR